MRHPGAIGLIEMYTVCVDRAVTQQSMELYEINATLGSRDVKIIDLGFEAETLYASGDVLYLIYTSGVFDPDYSRYVGALVAALP